MPEENLPQSDIDALLATMKREAVKQRRFNRFRVGYLIAILLSYIVFLTFVVSHHHRWGGLINFLSVLQWLPGIMLSRMNSERRKNTVYVLSTANDIRIIGPLCDVLGFGDKGMAEIAQETLIKILPRLQSSASHLLNSEQRDRLYKTLSGENRPLILAILKALEQIGDEKAIPFVEKLAAGKPLAKVSENEVREAAQNCLPFLRQRAAAQKAGQELLRASSPDTNNATLLRPAAAHATEPQELLRASGNGPQP